MKKTLGLLVILFTVQGSLCNSAFGAQGAEGRIFLDETFFPILGTKTDTDSTAVAPGSAAESDTGFDTHTSVGYIFSPGVLVGFTYNYYKSSAQRAAVAGGDDSLDESLVHSDYGPTFGYLQNGWRILGTYLISGTQTRQTVNKGSDGVLNGNVTVTQSDLTGFQFSLGYTFALGSTFEIGPSVVYRNVSYAKQEKVNVLNATETYASTALFTKKTESSLSPMLSMQFRF